MESIGEYCLHCGKSLKEGHARGHRSFCSNFCYNRYRSIKILKERSNRLIDSSLYIEGEDYVIDQWNGLATPRIYGKWFDIFHPDRKYEEYKSEFPDKPVQSLKDKKAVSSGGGAHMKTEKYRELFSEKFKGDNNPCSKARTTEQQRRERSPYCEEFYIKRGLPLSMRDEVLAKAKDKRKSHFSKEYWIEKGHTEEEAIEQVKKIRATNGLESYVKRYGEEEGTRRYNERISKYAKKMSEKYHRGEYSTRPKIGGYRVSSFEKAIIDRCIDDLHLDESEVYCYKGDNHQLILEGEEHCKYYYDFCYKDKIIEFNGDYWHMNPAKYKADHYAKQMKKTAAEIWEADRIKKEVAERKGYKVLYIWEKDAKKNFEGCVEKCIEFLNEVTEAN